MFPRLLEIGPITVYTYGLLLAAAYLTGLQVSVMRARARGLDAGRVMDLGIWIIISAVVGAKLLLLAVDFETFRQRPMEIFSLVRSGGVFFGGVIAASLVTLWYVKRHGIPVWPLADSVAPALSLAHAIGRVGCFFGGCCYGRPTSLPWGITFHDPFTQSWVGTPLGIPLHPTQLYEVGLELLILAVLLTTERRGRPFPGRTFWLYGVLYGVARFVVEFFRGDERGMIFGLPTSQFISIVLVPLSVVMLVRLARAHRAAQAMPPAPGNRPRKSR